ncbi:MAG TPA: polysaccharide biosynthesis C-terminal domain-containing protein, partial [Desulfurivibrionaceae bacterium]|nr:polysaccharide biosynthesis C-terminal domain-containing protein [Desulfurivibrionaceae bacterium]
EQGQNLFLYFAVPITAGLVLLAPDLLPLLAGTDFLVERTLIAWIALGHLCLGIYSINSYLIDLSQRTGLFLIILLCAAGLNLALNALLIPRLGLPGAAMATFAAYALQATLLWSVTKRLVGFRLAWHPSWLLRCLAAAGLMSLLLRLLPAPTTLWQTISLILAGALCYTGLTFLFLAREERRRLLVLLARGPA